MDKTKLSELSDQITTEIPDGSLMGPVMADLQKVGTRMWSDVTERFIQLFLDSMEQAGLDDDLILKVLLTMMAGPDLTEGMTPTQVIDMLSPMLRLTKEMKATLRS